MRSVVEGDVDLVVEAAFFPDPSYRGVMVEVGAAKPDFLSIGAHFRSLDWRVISIEPNPVFCDLHRALGHDIVECACGEADMDDMPFSVVHTNGDYYGRKVTDESFSSLGVRGKYAELMSPVSRAVEEITVKVRRLDTILREKDVGVVDIVCVDVEGWEMEVINGFSRHLYTSKVFIIENLFGEESYINQMTRFGYPLWKRLHPNDVFVRYDLF